MISESQIISLNLREKEQMKRYCNKLLSKLYKRNLKQNKEHEKEIENAKRK